MEQETQQPTQQPIPEYDYSNYSGGNSSESDRVGLARELDPQNTLVEIIWQLRGKLKNPRTGKFDIEFERMMNEKGIAIFITQVKAAANQITTYSNYRADEKIIYRILNKWVLDLVYIFYYERKKFIFEGEKKCLIDDEAVVSLIINLAAGLMMSSFFKALGAGDRGAVTKTISEMIQRAMRDVEPQSHEQVKRKGFISKMNPFSRR